jgi:3-methylcrotonyl-CoA carboxylase alpha subunit
MNDDKSATTAAVTHVGGGRYHVVHLGRAERVYAIVSAGERWAFWNGQVFREGTAAAPSRTSGLGAGAAAEAAVLAAPMPATVLKVLVEAGGRVDKGETLVLLEAMKMELSVRAPRRGTVKAIRCRQGDLVQPDQVLVELDP